MNLKELKEVVDFSMKQLQGTPPEKVPVLVTLYERGIGPRAATKIKHAGLGFDWEMNQFRLESEELIVRKGNSIHDVKPVLSEEFNGRQHYFCSNEYCRSKIFKKDRYCRECGQKLK